MIQGRLFPKLRNYLSSDTLVLWVWLFWLSWPTSKTNKSISYHCKWNYLSMLNWQKQLFLPVLDLAKKPHQLKYCGFISHEGRINGKTCYIFFSVAFKGRVLLGEEMPLFLQSGMNVLTEMLFLCSSSEVEWVNLQAAFLIKEKRTLKQFSPITVKLFCGMPRTWGTKHQLPCVELWC